MPTARHSNFLITRLEYNLSSFKFIVEKYLMYENKNISIAISY